jgi:FKBP-type peptidyl-prolyl cis-trans isomerase 2
MIKIKELKDEDIGRMVVYHSHNEKQDGRITSWNERFIFVDFDNTGRGQACNPKDLEFTYGGKNEN